MDKNSGSSVGWFIVTLNTRGVAGRPTRRSAAPDQQPRAFGGAIQKQQQEKINSSISEGENCAAAPAVSPRQGSGLAPR